MEFKASLDLFSKFITTLVAILFLAIILFVASLNEHYDFIRFAISIFTIGLFVSIFAFCFFYRIKGYVVENGKITVIRPFRDVTIDITQIKDVYTVPKDSLRWTIKTFGNGGLFGYFGHFYNSYHGNLIWYATKRDNYLIIETLDKGKIVLTPDDVKMISALKREMNH